MMSLQEWIDSQKWLRDKKPSEYGDSSGDRWLQWELTQPPVNRTDDEWDERLMEWLLD